jgi:hypothetical protein
MMMICSAPRRFAAITPQRPTAPSPTTAAVLPGPTLAHTAAWWPVPITSASVRRDGISASSSPAGSTASVPSAWGTRTASACAPATGPLPKNPPLMQAVCSLSWQKMQVPSEKANGMTTKSPCFMVRTSAPISSTVAIASWPITRPVSLCGSVLYGQRSLPQMQARVTRMMASVGSSILGSGTFSIRTSPAPYMTVARICRYLPASISGAAAYSSSVTCSPQVAALLWSSTCCIARWVMKRLGAAPCQ